MKEALSIALARKIIIGENATRVRAQMLAEIPAEERANYPEDDDDAALAYFDTFFANHPELDKKNGAAAAGLDGLSVKPSVKEGTGTTSPTQTQQTSSVDSQPVAMDAEAVKTWKAELAARADVQRQNSVTSSINRLCLDKPAANTYLQADWTIIPTPKKSMDEYRAKLVQTEENLKAFEELAKAVADKTPVPINIPKTPPKVIGVEMNRADGEGTKQETFTNQRLQMYLATETVGVLPNSTPDSIGCRLSWVQPRRGSTSQKNRSGSPRVVLSNKKTALDNAALHVVTSEIEMVGGKQKEVEGLLRTAASFKIISDKTDKDNKPLIRTVRLSGTHAVPVFKRKDDYLPIFGTCSKNKNIQEMPQSEKEINDFRSAQAMTLEYYRTQNVEIKGMDEVMKKLSAGTDASEAFDLN